MSRSLLSVIIIMVTLASSCASRPGSDPEPTAPPMPENNPTAMPVSEPSPASLDLPPLLVRAANSGLLYPLDPATGDALPGYEPIPTGPAYTSAFSPDGLRLAFVSEKGVLTLIDLPAWTHQTYELELPRPVFQAVFTPDGEHLAVAAGRHTIALALVDLARGEVAAEGELDFLVHKMKFTADGSGLMAYGTRIEKRFTVNEISPEPAQVALLDAASLDILWAQALQGVQHGILPKDGADPEADLHQPGQALYLTPGLAFAPDRDALYVAPAGKDELVTVDFAARQVSTLEIHDRLSWLERLLSLGAGRARAKIAEGTSMEAAVSPDGRRLYLVGGSSSLVDPDGGDWQVEHTPLGLQVIDTASGERLAWHESQASSLSISPDGGSLYLRAWGEREPWTEVFDIALGQVTARLEGVYLQPVRALDGRFLLASNVSLPGDPRFRYTLLDPGSLQQVGEWVSEGYLTALDR